MTFLAASREPFARTKPSRHLPLYRMRSSRLSNKRAATTDMGVARVLLIGEDGEQIDPAVFVTAVEDWYVGDALLFRAREPLRIISIDTEVVDELVQRGISAVFTVEPA
jgi:hypothetical protein